MNHDAPRRTASGMWVVAAAQLLAALLAGWVWFWSTASLQMSVYEMSDQLVMDGAIGREAAARIRSESGSIGSYIEQGHDGAAWSGGWILVGVSLAAPAVTLLVGRKKETS